MAKKQKHILVLSSWFPTEQSPFLGNFVVRQIELLATKYRVSVINCQPSGNVSAIETEILERGNVTHIKTLYPLKKTLIQRKLKQKRAFEKSLDKLENVDLIIGNVLLPNGWQFVLAKRRFKCPLFYVEHGSYFSKDMYEWRRIDQMICKKVGDVADEVIVVSDFLKKDLLHYYPKSTIRVIGNHIDADLFKYERSVPNEVTEFLHVSTLDERTKNPLGILKAASILAEKGLKFRLTIISDEDYRKWKTLSYEYGLQDHVIFEGPLEWEQLPPHYQRADAFILFSKYETFSIVLAEAWSTGTPVVSTPVGIASELNNDLGTRVNIDDVQGLASIMERFISGDYTFDPEKIREHALQYSSPRILQKWSDLIESYG